MTNRQTGYDHPDVTPYTVDCTDAKTISDRYNRRAQGTEDWHIQLTERCSEWTSTYLAQQ